MVPCVFHLDPVFSTWCWVFHQTPYFSPELTCSVSTSPCVFHQTPCIPHPVISHPPGPRSLGPHTDIFHQALLKFLFSGCCMWIKKKTDHMMTNISSPQFAAQLLLKNREFRAIVSIDRFCICKHFLATTYLKFYLAKKKVRNSTTGKQTVKHLPWQQEFHLSYDHEIHHHIFILNRWIKPMMHATAWKNVWDQY